MTHDPPRMVTTYTVMSPSRMPEHNADAMQAYRITRENTILLVIVLFILALVIPLKGIFTPLLLHLAGLCGFLKPYQPDSNNQENAAEDALMPDKTGIDKWVKQCDCPYTGT